MDKRRLIPFVNLGVACGIAATAMAGTVRLQGRPSASDNGVILTVAGTLEGLGAHDFTVRVRATGTATVRCVNPAGNQPPGARRQVAVVTSGEQRLTASRITESSAAFAVSTTEPDVAKSCPGEQWNPEVSDIAFRTVTVRVFQDGRVVLRRTWSL